MKLPKFEKNNKLFWLYIVLGAIVTIFAIIFAPFWSSVNVPWKNWSQSILNLIIAAFLSLYLFCFLIMVLPLAVRATAVHPTARFRFSTTPTATPTFQAFVRQWISS